MDMTKEFKAFLVEKHEDQKITSGVQTRNIHDLPPGNLLIKVAYSSLNYKDALSATGHPGVTKRFPHTPGIDAVGEVVCCQDDSFKTGDKVLVTGYDLGMDTDGGWGEYIRIPSSWGVPLPPGLTAVEAMTLGTAGFTAALSLFELEQSGVTPSSGEILVTGATGGVGSIAVSILSKAGYNVMAATGKTSEEDFLRTLGANEVISYQNLKSGSERPMMKERWGGVIDVVGGEILTAAIKSTRYLGSVTCCGLVLSPDLTMNVYPFILRGVRLIGIDSVNCPPETRFKIWERLSGSWKPEKLNTLNIELPLEGLGEKIHDILHGKSKGRIVVKLP